MFRWAEERVALSMRAGVEASLRLLLAVDSATVRTVEAREAVLRGVPRLRRAVDEL